MSSRDIVVWEWKEDNDQWIPYDPDTCYLIESAWLNNVGVFQLGSNNVALVMYEILFGEMVQRNMYSDMTRSVRRRNCTARSPLAKGYTWEWFRGAKNSGVWCSYSTELMQYLEDNRGNKSGTVSFPAHFHMPHEIDFKTKKQKNKVTGFKRNIQRRKLTSHYPSDLSTLTGTPRPGNAVNVPKLPPAGYSSSNALPMGHQSHHVQSNIGYGSSRAPQTVRYPGTSSIHNPYVVRPAQSPHLPMQFNSQNGSTSNYFHSNGSINPQTTSLTPASRPLPPVPAQAAGIGSISTGGARRKTSKLNNPIRRSSTLSPCPRGGIPCDSAATSGTIPVKKVLKKYSTPAYVDSKSTNQCSICQSLLTEESGFSGSSPSMETVELNLCNHVFHTECVRASYEHSVQNGCIICPSCNRMHGIKTGNQPPGTMHYSTMPNSLPGNTGVGTIEIVYDIRPGTQTSEHPHPGRPFSAPAFPRIGYLPDNEDGRNVLSLLIEAWKRRLIFTVGQSSTSGQDDCVTWTGIHHKTEMVSRRGHGYPDDTYFDRVLSELEAEGVVPEEG